MVGLSCHWLAGWKLGGRAGHTGLHPHLYVRLMITFGAKRLLLLLFCKCCVSSLLTNSNLEPYRDEVWGR